MFLTISNVLRFKIDINLLTLDFLTILRLGSSRDTTRCVRRPEYLETRVRRIFVRTKKRAGEFFNFVSFVIRCAEEDVYILYTEVGR